MILVQHAYALLSPRKEWVAPDFIDSGYFCISVYTSVMQIVVPFCPCPPHISTTSNLTAKNQLNVNGPKV